MVAFITIGAVPYMLMKRGMIREGTFEIFVFADFVIAIGLLRAFWIRLRDILFPAL